MLFVIWLQQSLLSPTPTLYSTYVASCQPLKMTNTFIPLHMQAFVLGHSLLPYLVNYCFFNMQVKCLLPISSSLLAHSHTLLALCTYHIILLFECVFPQPNCGVLKNRDHILFSFLLNHLYSVCSPNDHWFSGKKFDKQYPVSYPQANTDVSEFKVGNSSKMDKVRQCKYKWTKTPPGFLLLHPQF